MNNAPASCGAEGREVRRSNSPARTNSPLGCSARRGAAKQVPSGKLAADLSALGSSTAEVAQPCVPAIELREVSFSYGKEPFARFRTQELRRLSGGERQRAFIAMTLAQDTDLIVLDEPTTYLDIRACHETMELIRRLNEEAGKTIVMVIHDLDLALRYSDRLLVMERGRAAAAGTVEEVLATGAIERAFGVSIRPHEAAEGRAYTLFPA